MPSVLPVILISAHMAVTPPHKEGVVIVKPLEGSSIEEITTAKSIEKIGKAHIISVSPNAEEAVALALSKNPKVEFAEVDRAVLPDFIPNDPSYPNQWHLTKINAATGWDVTVGSGITIAICDSGVNTAHPDLVDRIAPGGVNIVDGSTDTSDVQGHGTAVAGTAAATINNAIGVAGVAGNASILPLRISNSTDGYAYYSDMAKCIRTAADKGAKVVNLSYGGYGSSLVSDAATYMRSKGGVAVISAGNDNTTPVANDILSQINVSATTQTDVKASWSNFGSYIDLSAPGTSILTTTRSLGYANYQGTSFAAPIVAGTAALIYSVNSSLSPGQVEYILETSADKIFVGDFDPYYGYGRVNAGNAVIMAQSVIEEPPPPPDTVFPSITINSPEDGQIVSGRSIKVQVSATDNVQVQQIVLQIDGKTVKTSLSNYLTYNWGLRKVSAGEHTIKALATDTSNNTSATTITVQK